MPCSAANSARSSYRSTRSQGMWSATVGTQPVKRLTVAASAIFANGSLAAPGWAKTLNRVPELP